ncbi:MAG: DNA polymerase III subunit beta [Deltaproteobacteria bacterium]|nr:DNA polymerase III subunit beta [Deltaproteobacteria bacterium]
MEFTIDKRVFLESLGKVQGLCGRRTSFPITGNVMLIAGKDEITIVATDLEVGFSGTYPAAVAEPGKAAIPGKKLFEIIREFPTESVTCKEKENGWFEISGASAQFKVVGMDPEEFPALPDLSGVASWSLDSADFLDMVEKVNLSGTVAAEERRPHLLGFLLQKVEDEDGKKRLRMVSTDGHRLSLVDYLSGENDPGQAIDAEEGVILPKKLLPEILKIMEEEGPVSLGSKGSYFVLEQGEERLVCRLVEGKYPDYNMVIPKEIETFFTVNKEFFLSILRRMSILASDKYRAVRFKVEKNQLLVSMVNPDMGESMEPVTVDFNGEPFEVAFNPRFFVDAMGPMVSEQVRIKIKDDEHPCIVEGDDEPGYIAVIMPMKLD